MRRNENRWKKCRYMKEMNEVRGKEIKKRRERGVANEEGVGGEEGGPKSADYTNVSFISLSL